MKKSIFSLEWKSPNDKTSKCMLDLNNPSEVMTAEYNEPVPSEAID